MQMFFSFIVDTDIVLLSTVNSYSGHTYIGYIIHTIVSSVRLEVKEIWKGTNSFHTNTF